MILFVFILIAVSFIVGINVSEDPKMGIKIISHSVTASEDTDRFYLEIDGDSDWLYKVSNKGTTLLHLGKNTNISYNMKAKIDMNRRNPKQTIDRFYKLLVLL